MTPEQLRAYVDSALATRDHWSLIAYIALPFIALFGGFLAAYIAEKGKNHATKEDVGKITSEIEKAKVFYSERIERLKAELASRGHFSKSRYEREMKIYETLWPKLCSFREAVLSLRPIMDSALKEGETEEKRKRQRAEVYASANHAVAEVVEHNRPFYPAQLWAELRKLQQMSWKEAVDWRFGEERDWSTYWDRAEKNAAAINTQIDAICEAIRKRLSQFDEPDSLDVTADTVTSESISKASP